MLIDTLEDSNTYMKSTLLACLREAHRITSEKIPVTYKTVLRREKEGIEAYLSARRDPGSNWRMYTGRQIRSIIEYEISRATPPAMDAAL